MEVPTKFLEVLVKFLTLKSSGEVSDHVPNLIVLCQDQQFFNKFLFTSPVIPSLGVRSNKVLTQVKWSSKSFSSNRPVFSYYSKYLCDQNIDYMYMKLIPYSYILISTHLLNQYFDYTLLQVFQTFLRS